MTFKLFGIAPKSKQKGLALERVLSSHFLASPQKVSKKV
jgi:hypothetical protein